MICIDLKGAATGVIFAFLLAAMISAAVAGDLAAKHALQPLLDACSAARYNWQEVQPTYWWFGWLFFWSAPSFALLFGKVRIRIFKADQNEIDEIEKEHDEVGL
ncbi:hypothetical protein HTZ97_05575 [Desulfuromonas acetoxidans]|uniref:Uncharacterized protein n=1 Tax=Desulfuromonas acetoxidans (strain DSM 684 / 11070) TaxID=281689 RepID=Q1K2Y5_DESA6|nr:hypothetical protein [Desulfuromonas acetoxidans]EAT16746.1 hypothetical protein Dace_1998 [Desulfuromonas acetoxidans DSM 684]NVD23687.1 hypothetical protein [Desulfuromonas acetoxidans]NVE15928.1 hypothetical protein [Desulfuromonas acetoxidans]